MTLKKTRLIEADSWKTVSL